jgi:PKD repeat protein
VHHPTAGVCHAAFTAHQPDPDVQSINFIDQSTSDGTIGSWAWDFGDGSASSEQNPSHTYAHSGTYLVCLTITDDDGGCTSHVCHHVVVHHPPVGVCHAMFKAHQPSLGQLSVEFTDQSTSDGIIGSWVWDFGDGNTSMEQNPTHTYAHSGTYLVCLIITDDDGGCTSHQCLHVVVHHPQVNANYTRTDETSNGPAHNFRSNTSSPEYHALIPQSSIQSKSKKGSGAFHSQEYIVNYPNPFVSSTTIQYELTDDADVIIEIYDMLGHRISQIITEKESAGIHTQLLSADKFDSGFYWIKMVVGEETFAKKITVSK